MAAVSFAIQGGIVASGKLLRLDVEVRLPVLLRFPEGQEFAGLISQHPGGEGGYGTAELGDLHAGESTIFGGWRK